jgi:PAS domain S-box-containing protein
MIRAGRDHPFLAAGETGAMIAARDWSGTPLGPIDAWPACLRGSLALVLRATVPMVILWGEHGTMLYNDAYAVVAGSRHPRSLGSRARESWPEVASFNDNVLRVGLAGGTLAYRDEPMTLLRSGDPEQVWFDLDYSPIVDDAGVPRGVLAIVSETTVKVRAERRIQDEQGRLRQFFEQAPGIMAILEGREHVFTLANQACLDFVGGRAVLGRAVAEALPELVEQGFVGLLDSVAERRETYIGRGVAVRIGRGNGVAPEERFVDFVYQPILDKAGEVDGIFVQGHDVTEQHRASVAARESETRFRLVAESAPVMLWMSDTSGQCAYLNAAQRAFWGIHLADLSRFDWADTIHEDDRAAVAEALAVSIDEQRPLSLELRLRRADGTYRQVLTTAHPRVAPDGAFLGMIGVNADITEIREYQASLQALNETLEERVAEAVAERSLAEEALRQAQKMEALGKLTGGVAHDFNNLLQVISGNLQLLARDRAGDPRAEGRIATALAAVGQGAKLASQLLAFGRRQPLEPRVVNPGRLVASMGELLRRTIGDGIEVETVVGEGVWNGLVDPVQLEAALLNLAVNARDAMGAYGRLRIEVGNVVLGDADARRSSDVEPGAYVVVAVSDTGSGIAPELLEKVFEPFYSTKPVGKGTGLGLSMVYGFVKQSGGHVKIESAPGEGTTVRVYLPRTELSEDRPTRKEAGPDTGPIGGGTETILVAEDDPDVRATVVAMLRDLGYRVLSARDAASALAVVEGGETVDLVFTDVVMPGPLRSTDLVRSVRERLPGIAVLFTSGYAQDAIVHDGRLDPGLDLLSKPYTREALARKLRQVLAKAATPPPPSPSPSAGPRHVLLCEDDALIRMSAADILDEAGMAVVEAGSGRQALAALSEKPVDLCIVDVGLPDMTGIELFRSIRADFPAIPVLFATGHAHLPEVDGEARIATLSKPYDEHGLLAAVAGLWERA